MNVGILVIQEGESVSDFPLKTDVTHVSKKLDEYGYAVNFVAFVTNSERIYATFCTICEDCEALLVLGAIDKFKDAFGEKYEFDRKVNTLVLEEKICVFAENCSDAFVSDVLIPALNSSCKTFYATAIFKTFGKTEAQLRELLKDYIKNRNRIVFKFFPGQVTCDVHVRYSTKTSKPVVDAVISGVTELLKEYTYALKDVSLVKQAADLLLLRGKTLALAESFTGGGIASALVGVNGISAALKEGIVCYSNDSKILRLHVEKEIVENYGAVSIETVYEMAANLLMEKRCDIAIATSGNAGPTSEKPDENGVCFIAVGNAKEINIYRYRFEGDRAAVIQSGVDAALFHLYKLLTLNEFEVLLKAQTNLPNE